MPESRSARRVVLGAAFVAALAVLVAGAGYTARPRTTYESQMSFVMTPKQDLGPAIRAGLIESFANSGTAGTFVELLGNRAPMAGPGVSMTARAVPDTRVVNLTARGPVSSLAASLKSVSVHALADQSALSDLWSLDVLEAPSAPTLTGHTQSELALVTVCLAILAAAAVVVGLGQAAGTHARP